jgi:Zn-finger nucleic acid-binding protein
MKCPTCDVNLLMTDRNGIEIDYCPQCRGIWLDRGELDKIIERSQVATPGSHNLTSHKDPKPYGYKEREYEYKKHKKDSFLGDLFDF